MALHAIAYCERLFYLEEVEEIRVQDGAVFAGRELHAGLELEDSTGREFRAFSVSSERLGITGRIDALRRRGGSWTPYEHKRGRAARGHGGAADAWQTDRIQVAAYAMLLEEETGEPVPEGRVRYHETGVTVRVPIDERLREQVVTLVARAQELRLQTQRPPIADNSRLCLRCSLAPVCLPEEERLSRDSDWRPVRLFPPNDEGQVIHVTSHDARVGRSGESLVVTRGGEEPLKLPVRQVDSLIIHGNAQVTTHALHLCSSHRVPVHWFTSGGRYLVGADPGGDRVQRRIRQYEALTDEQFALGLARRLAAAKIESQLRFVLRATRGREAARAVTETAIIVIRRQLKSVASAPTTEALRGFEGTAARAYFDILPTLVADVDPRLLPVGRSRRPPRDRFNAALSFLYSLLFRSVNQAITAVGLEPSLGFFHTPRGAAAPLALDLIELFRVPLSDMPLVASLNRKQWDPVGDFTVAKDHVWLSPTGRRKAIEIYERRIEDKWRHPVLGYSLSYSRAIQLEVRLLEKEWTGTGGMFARSRLR